MAKVNLFVDIRFWSTSWKLVKVVSNFPLMIRLKDILKAPWKRLESVLKTSWTCLEDCCYQFIFSVTSWRRFCYLLKASWRRLEDVLKTSWRRIFQTSWRRPEDVWPRRTNSSWSRRLKEVKYICLGQDILKTFSEDEDERLLQDVFKTSSPRRMLAGRDINII